jgi:hypothetical protein
MTENPPDHDRPVSQVVAAGVSLAAGALLFTAAVLTVLQGIEALVDKSPLIIGSNYVYKFNTTGWGWTHVAVGIVLGIVAVGLIREAVWARVTAIVMACVSIVFMFLWLPYYPMWSIIVIALDVIVIWAVAMRDTTALSRRSSPM